MSSFANRMIRAAKLDVSLYEEVEKDHSATGQATAVIILSSLAAGIGSLRSLQPRGISGLVFITLATLLGWLVWAILTDWIGTRLLPEPQTKADLGQMLRTVGFSSSPGLIRILGVVPGLGFPLALVAGIWMLIAMVVAVRQALDYTSTARAVGVCAIGWTIEIILFVLIPGPFSGTAY